MSLVPKKVFFVKGKGFHKIKLAAFEQALRDAGIEKYNLVKVSSILPPYCIEINNEDGLEQIRPGQVLYSVISRNNSNKFNDLITASVGVAKPAEKGNYGYLSEHHALGINPQKVGDFSENLAAEMLATTLGISFNPNLNFDQKKEVFRMGGKIIETKNITCFATVKEEDEWATVIAAAIFIL